MFSRWIKLVLSALIGPVFGMSVAQAEYSNGPRLHDHGHRPADASFYAGDGLPTHIRRLGTFSGGIAGYRDRGNGNYFAVERRILRGSDAGRPSPRIIHVNSSAFEAACSREAGVCVIRP